MTILDGLTGVHNKRYFLEFLEREMARAQRHHAPLSLVMFDIDHFKKVNDTHGHLAGDAVLKELAAADASRGSGARTVRALRRRGVRHRHGVDLVARAPSDFAEELRQLVEGEPFRTDTVVLPVTVSIGVAEVDASMKTPEELIGKCDAHLYSAKRQGRNCVVG